MSEGTIKSVSLVLDGETAETLRNITRDARSDQSLVYNAMLVCAAHKSAMRAIERYRSTLSYAAQSADSGVYMPLESRRQPRSAARDYGYQSEGYLNGQ